ncbi:MAG: hypothetical protein HYY49_10335 [Ignavibacteriales bacterium]|nr:hypothetical protein [Ignavibacteriales bacterium]
MFDRFGIWKPTIVVRKPEEETPILTFAEKWFGKKHPHRRTALQGSLIR